MPRDILRATSKRCFACAQWEGNRTYDPKGHQIKTDPSQQSNCRLWHRKTPGRQTCDKFEPLA